MERDSPNTTLIHRWPLLLGLPTSRRNASQSDMITGLFSHREAMDPLRRGATDGMRSLVQPRIASRTATRSANLLAAPASSPQASLD